MSEFPENYHKLRDLCEEIKYGELRLKVQNGLPVLAVEPMKSVKLGEG